MDLELVCLVQVARKCWLLAGREDARSCAQLLYQRGRYKIFIIIVKIGSMMNTFQKRNLQLEALFTACSEHPVGLRRSAQTITRNAWSVS